MFEARHEVDPRDVKVNLNSSIRREVISIRREVISIRPLYGERLSLYAEKPNDDSFSANTDFFVCRFLSNAHKEATAFNP